MGFGCEENAGLIEDNSFLFVVIIIVTVLHFDVLIVLFDTVGFVRGKKCLPFFSS